jgi:hypothetical protein
VLRKGYRQNYTSNSRPNYGDAKGRRRRGHGNWCCDSQCEGRRREGESSKEDRKWGEILGDLSLLGLTYLRKITTVRCTTVGRGQYAPPYTNTYCTVPRYPPCPRTSSSVCVVTAWYGRNGNFTCIMGILLTPFSVHHSNAFICGWHEIIASK